MHLPFAFINRRISLIFFSSQLSNGFKSCSLFELELIFTFLLEPFFAGGLYPRLSTENPFFGKSSPKGGLNLSCTPFLLLSESLRGLNVKSPEIAIAVTISGDATKAWVLGLPSALLEKFLLNE